MTGEPEDRFSGNGQPTLAPSHLPADITQDNAVRSFQKAGGVLKKSKRGHAVLKMLNGRLVSLPSGTLKKGLLQSQIKLGGLTVDKFLDYLKGARR